MESHAERNRDWAIRSIAMRSTRRGSTVRSPGDDSMKLHSQTSARREFLHALAGGALGLALAGKGWSAAAKPMRGVFPKGGFSKVEDVLDRPVISNILLEEPILEGR